MPQLAMLALAVMAGPVALRPQLTQGEDLLVRPPQRVAQAALAVQVARALVVSPVTAVMAAPVAQRPRPVPITPRHPAVRAVAAEIVVTAERRDLARAATVALADQPTP